MKKHREGGYGSEVQGHMVGNISEVDPDMGARFTAFKGKVLYLPRWSKQTKNYSGYEKADGNLLSNRPRLKDK